MACRTIAFADVVGVTKSFQFNVDPWPGLDWQRIRLSRCKYYNLDDKLQPVLANGSFERASPEASTGIEQMCGFSLPMCGTGTCASRLRHAQLSRFWQYLQQQRRSFCCRPDLRFHGGLRSNTQQLSLCPICYETQKRWC